MSQIIRLGPAGSPSVSTLDGVRQVAALGLQAMEVEFVYGVKMSNSTARDVGKVARELGISLSVHAPYYINLNSDDGGKIDASKARLLLSCERAHNLGAGRVVFHPGFYGKLPREQAFLNIRDAIADVQSRVVDNGWEVLLSPEIMGKVNVFGSVDEVLGLVRDVKCSCCVDFAHILARNQGSVDYAAVLDSFSSLKHIHCHFSGIEFGEKGERRHLLTPLAEMDGFAAAVLQSGLDVTVINESPDPVGDSLRMKSVFEKLGHVF